MTLGLRIGLATWLALVLAPAGALAQPVVASAGPDEVDVTLYRDPQRPAARAPNLNWLNGFALVSETRTIAIPAGESVIRFEGVAGGILPQSVVVTGIPDDIVERNRDAYLLSPGTLLDRSLGRRVHLRRTSRATGAVREQEAIVRSGADGAVVLQTDQGFEALRCTGLSETLVYDEVPAGLSARPTLSLRVRARQPVSARVTLSYLASGFDWQANYVANLADDGRSLQLFAWLTLASTDETSFERADTQAVAGRVNRAYTVRQPPETRPLALNCWPQGTTSDIDEDSEQIVVTGSRIPAARAMMAAPAPPPPPPPPPALEAAMQASQEELGDLKLYRIPEPVTLAARSQKQVAFLARPSVEVETVYRRRFGPVEPDQAVPARRVLVSRNRTAEGLGVPLPAGGLVLFAQAGDRPILVGQGVIGDRAVGEDVEIDIGPAAGVTTQVRALEQVKGRNTFELVVTNDQPRAVPFEAEFQVVPNVFRSSARTSRRNGMPLWRTNVPANGRVTLRFSYVTPR